MPFTIPLSPEAREILHKARIEPEDAPVVPDFVAEIRGGNLEVLRSNPFPSRLPLFMKSGPKATSDLGRAVARTFFDTDFEEEHRTDDTLRMTSGSRVLEMDARAGWLWLADERRVYGRDGEVDRQPVEQAVAAAIEAARRLAPLLENDESRRVRPVLENLGGTFLDTLDLKTGAFRRKRLNTRVHFGERLASKAPDALSELPVLLSDALTVTLAPDGALVGLRASLHQVGPVEAEVAIRDPREVAELIAHGRGIPLSRLALSLVYVATLRKGGARLEPTWLVQGWDDRVPGVSSPLRTLMVAAFDAAHLGPIRPSAKALSARRSSPPEGPLFKAGTVWLSANERSSAASNAAGFLAELPTSTWETIFHHGNSKAKLSDWKTKDDTFVDRADIVFYCGHADAFGWQLQDGWMDASTIPANHDWWGDTNLGWLVIAACGPLQDPAPGTSDYAVERWRSAFQGLRGLFGYQTTSADALNEGSTFVAKASSDTPLIDAWLYAGWMAQPNKLFDDPVLVGGLYAENGDGSTELDKLPGVTGAPGSVPFDASRLRLKFGTC